MGFWQKLKIGIARSFLNSIEKGYGDRMMARIMLSQGLNYTWPGGWSQDRLEQVRHFRHWVYVAVRFIMDNVTVQPNIDYIKYGVDHTEKNVVWRKSQTTIKSSDEVEPVEHNHPLRRLLGRPNQQDSPFDLWSELALFLKITGNGYLWKVRNGFGKPQELWVIPSHWMWAQPGRERFIDCYELRPWTGYAGAPAAKIPYRDIIHIKQKSPITKIDGYATSTAISQWIDIMESQNTFQWSSFKNQGMPNMSIELGPEYADPTDAELDRIYQKFFNRFGGESRAGIPMITPPGAKVTPLTFTPVEMSYVESADQMRDNILAAYGVPKACVGLAETGTIGAVLANQSAFCQWTLNPYLRMIGEAITKDLASEFAPEEPNKEIKVWWPDTTPPDPEQINRDIEVDRDTCAISPNEVRALRGRPSWTKGGNNPLLPGSMVEIPLAEEKKLELTNEMETSFPMLHSGPTETEALQ